MNDYLKKLAIYGQRLSPQVAKAVSTTTPAGDSLTVQWLAKEITKAIVLLNPELFLIMERGEKSTKGTNKFTFNKLVSLPKSGSSYGKYGVNTQRTGSEYVEVEREMKILRRIGNISGPTNAFSGATNLPEDEFQNQLEVMGHDITSSCLQGNSAADPRRWDGLDSMITRYRINEGRYPNVIKDFTSLAMMVARSNSKGGIGHDRVILMSPELWAKFNLLITTVRDPKAPVTPGSIGKYETFKFDYFWSFVSFMGIPVLETSWTKPDEKMKPDITLTKESTEGTLTDGTYYIEIAPVTKHGEQIASSEVSVTLDAGNATQRIKITLSESHKSLSDAGKWEEETYYYRIYMSTTSQKEKLVKVVTAQTYDSDGNLLTSDNGVDGKDFYVSDLVDANSVNSAMEKDEPYICSDFDGDGRPINPPETMILWDLDQPQGIGTFGYTNEEGSAMDGLVTTEWLPYTDDYKEVMIKVYGCLVDRNTNTSIIHRGVKGA